MDDTEYKKSFEKLKDAKSAEEVIAIAKECGKELTTEKAREIYDKLKAFAAGELSDEALEAVVGGEIRFPTFVIPDYV